MNLHCCGSSHKRQHCVQNIVDKVYKNYLNPLDIQFRLKIIPVLSSLLGSDERLFGNLYMSLVTIAKNGRVFIGSYYIVTN